MSFCENDPFALMSDYHPLHVQLCLEELTCE